MRGFALFLLLLLLLPVLSGCLEGDRRPSGEPREARGLTAPIDGAWPTDLKFRLRTADGIMLLYNVRPEVRIEIPSRPLSEEDRRDCDHRGKLEGRSYGWFTIWNRTGLVRYEEWKVDWDRPHVVELTLPDDPPYFIWPGLSCFGEGKVSFAAAAWRRSHADIRSYRDPDAVPPPTLVVEPFQLTARITIPPGESRGYATLPIKGETFFIEGGPEIGWTQPISGWRYGTLYIYEPNEEVGGPNWIKRIVRDPIDSTWSLRHQETGMPGDYTLDLRLSAPAPMETVWEVTVDAYRFKENLQSDFGFRLPFELYDRRWTVGG